MTRTQQFALFNKSQVIKLYRRSVSAEFKTATYGAVLPDQQCWEWLYGPMDGPEILWAARRPGQKRWDQAVLCLDEATAIMYSKKS